jgi:hypothetical protein
MYAIAAFIISLALIFIIDSSGTEAFLFLIAVITLLYSLVKYPIHLWMKKKTAVITNALDEYDRALKQETSLIAFIVRGDLRKTGKRRYLYYSWQILERYIIDKLKNEQEIDEEFIDKIIKQMEFPEQYARTLKIYVFRAAFSSFMEDEHLEDDEEKALRELALKLKLDDTDIEEELLSIDYMSELRKDAQKGLDSVKVDIKLQKSEKCYFAAEGKSIKERILQSRTVNGIKHKTIGFVEDRIGDVVLTNKRLLVIGGGTSTIKLDKIIDIILQFENNIVELIVDGKQKPFFVTTPKAPNLAVKIQQAIEGTG